MKNKLLVIFFGIGFLPFLLLLFYILFFGESKIINKTVLEQLDRTEIVIKQIDNHLNSLSKEVKFLSSLELMDDILAEDIDKRISRLLEHKRDDLNLDVRFSALSVENITIASSNKELLGLKQEFIFTTKEKSGIYRDRDKLFIYTKITASFDTARELGVLVLEYNLKNLSFYLINQQSIHSSIVHPAS